MKTWSHMGQLHDVIFRLLPHRGQTGLIRIGNPGRADPVLVTGNYTLTLRRIRKALAGFDIWLLAANSKGINVWCAAGGGYLTHRDVIAVVRTSRIAECIDHRELILPQLGATGIERRKVAEATGWQTKWGPARLEDLPEYLERGRRVKKADRFMRFPLWERLEMALVWLLPIMAICVPLAGIIGGWAVVAAVGIAIAAMVFTLFAILPKLNLHGQARWAVFAALAVAGALVALGLLALLSSATPVKLLSTCGLVFIATSVLSLDFEGTTPWYGSVINTFRNHARIELDSDLCTGETECVLVCPRNVLAMNGPKRKVEITRPDQCIQCGACIVQCPRDALHFRYDDGHIVEPETIRNTRLNMVGRRTIRLTGEDGDTSAGGSI